MRRGRIRDGGRRPRLRRLKFDLGKAMFVLPNAFTLSSVCCGLYAILLSTGDASPQQFYRAALAILFGTFFDGMDGRVARMTKTQSDFGVELDSLADAITFGVAPSIVVYRWALEPMGTVGLLAVFAYTSCGVARLARFNVLAHRSRSVSEHFIGLPIPLAAGTLVSLIIAHHSLGSVAVVRHGSVLAVVIVLSYLMVSNVRYRAFKGIRMSWRPLALAAGLLIGLALGCVILGVSPSLMLVALCGGYIVLGLLEEVLFFKKRRAAVPPQPKTAAGETSAV